MHFCGWTDIGWVFNYCTFLWIMSVFIGWSMQSENEMHSRWAEWWRRRSSCETDLQWGTSCRWHQPCVASSVVSHAARQCWVLIANMVSHSCWGHSTSRGTSSVYPVWSSYRRLLSNFALNSMTMMTRVFLCRLNEVATPQSGYVGAFLRTLHI